MNRTTKGVLGAGALVGAAALMACAPPPDKASGVYCGQTADGSAVVVLASMSANCPAAPGQKRIVVDELCGPIMQGTNVTDDCYRGTLAQVGGRLLYGPVIVRWGSFNQPGDVREVLVASDGTAP